MIENGAAEDPLDTFEAQWYGIEGKDARDNMTFASVEDLLNSDGELFLRIYNNQPKDFVMILISYLVYMIRFTFNLSTYIMDVYFFLMVLVV